MDKHWTSYFAAKPTSSFPGIQSFVRYDNIREQAEIAFMVQNNCLPSSCAVEHLSTSKVSHSLEVGWLREFHPVSFEIIARAQGIPVDFILQTESGSAVLYFYRSSARGGTYSLRILFKSEVIDEVMGWVRGPLHEMEKAEGAPNQGKFMLLSRDNYSGLECKEAAIKLKEVDLSAMYTAEIEKFAERVVPEMTDGSAGLYILHGPAGTGKTSFINYLIGKVARNFIFIPYNLVDSLPLPEFTELLWENRNSILIIEDAEKALQKRAGAEHSPVSALLNLTDGLLGDVLSLKVICTLNSDLASIDPALLRKGRLKGKCYFGKLSAVKANALAEKLGNSIRFESDVVLADVFRPDGVEFGQKDHKAVGFK